MTMPYRITKQQHANLVEALEVMWPSVPPENVHRNLSWWRKEDDERKRTQPPTCGTIACFGGWCAWWPSFQAQGVYAGTSGHPTTASGGFGNTLLFGDNKMFDPRNSHPADTSGPYQGFIGTDHEMVTNRLRYVLKHAEVIA